MAEIHHEIKVRAEPDRIREALTSPTSLEAWHGGRVTVANGALRFEFADGAPTFRWAARSRSAPQQSAASTQAPST